MTKARYILRVEDGELFGWNPDWLKLGGMVEYDPAVHGYRSEVAAQMGLVAPEPQKAAAPKRDTAAEPQAGAVAPTRVATERKAQGQRTDEPDLSGVFASR